MKEHLSKWLQLYATSKGFICVAPVFTIMRKLYAMSSVSFVSLLVACVSCSQEYKTSFNTAGCWFHQVTSKRFIYTTYKPPDISTLLPVYNSTQTPL